MRLPSRFFVLTATVVFAAILLSGSEASLGQDADVNLALHVKSHADAALIGLPGYPGATLYIDEDGDSAADLGVTVGDFHFSVVAVKYVTSDSPEKVLAFYRKPLSRYGEVLECDHGKPVGSRSETRTGLTCGEVQVSGDTKSSSGREIRAHTPHQYRIVGMDASHPGSTRFGLVYLDLPADSDQSKK